MERDEFRELLVKVAAAVEEICVGVTAKIAEIDRGGPCTGLPETLDGPIADLERAFHDARSDAEGKVA